MKINLDNHLKSRVQQTLLFLCILFCKTICKWSAATPQPLIKETDIPGSWNLQSSEYNIRDVSGKELAIYSNNSIEQWNLYGSDNVGKIDANNFRYFYLKDHLGSVRLSLNTTNIIAANDGVYPALDAGTPGAIH